MAVETKQVAGRVGNNGVSASYIAKIKKILKKYSKDDDSFGFVFPDGEHISIWDTHSCVQIEVIEKLDPNTDIHYTEYLLHCDCARIGQIDNTIYIETRNRPTSKAENTLLDIVYSKKNVGRILIDGGAYGKVLKRKLDHDLPLCEVQDTRIENTYEWWCSEDASRTPC